MVVLWAGSSLINLIINSILCQVAHQLYKFINLWISVLHYTSIQININYITQYNLQSNRRHFIYLCLAYLFDQLVVSPLILVHPSKKYIQDVHQGLFLKWKLPTIILKIQHNLVALVDYIRRFLGLPIILPVTLINRKTKVIHEAIQYPCLCCCPTHYL